MAGAPELRHLIVAGDGELLDVERVDVHRYGPLMTTAREAAAYDTWEESPGFWLCTSGTTGRPKLAMHRHVDLRLIAEGYAREVLEIDADDRCLSVAPLFHAYGLGNALVFPLSVGAMAIVEPTLPPKAALVADLVRAELPTLFFSVPTFYAALLAADLPKDTFASVRTAVSAGEPLPGDLFSRFGDRFGLEILDGIGSTEMTHIYISNRRGQAQPGSSGMPVVGYEIRLVDDSGQEVPAGVPGQLRVSGASAATGYWCRSQETRQSFEGEWFRSGDMYVRSHDGRYTYLGRADDMFKVGGSPRVGPRRTPRGRLTTMTAPPGLERFSLRGKAVLVTGASRGIGAAIAQAFAEAGADVALAARSRDALENLAREIEAGGQTAVAIPCDVTRADEVAACVDAAEQAFGRLTSW